MLKIVWQEDRKRFFAQPMVNNVRKGFTGKTEAEVRQKYIAWMKAGAQAPKPFSGEAARSLGDYLDWWLDRNYRPTDVPAKKAGRNERPAKTYDGYQAVITKHIAPRLGGIPLSKLSTVRIQDAFSRMAQEGVGERTQQLAFAVLRKALRDAMQMTPPLLDDRADPLRGVKRPKYRPEKTASTSVFSDDEIARIGRYLAQKDHRLRVLILLAIETGMRIGEVCALEVADIHGDTLFVGRKVVERKGEAAANGEKLRIEAFTKRHQGERPRDIELSDGMAALLREHVETIPRGSKLLFPTQRGTLHRPSNLTHDFDDVLKGAGVPKNDRSFHSLRHTNATKLLSDPTIPHQTIADRLGHTVEVLLATYSHSTDDMKRKAGKQAGWLFAIAANPQPGKITAITETSTETRRPSRRNYVT